MKVGNKMQHHETKTHQTFSNVEIKKGLNVAGDEKRGTLAE